MMKREILFAAKDLNGVWQEGLVTKDYADTWFITNGVDTWQIDPETISQWTGLLDKNGNKVFEGDIFTADEYPFVDDGRPNYYGLVEWIFAGFQYELKLANTDKRGISDGVNEILEDAGWLEVIGNRFDTPELIGKEAHNG